MGSCEMPDMDTGELRLECLQKQYVLLITEPSPQSHDATFCLTGSLCVAQADPRLIFEAEFYYIALGWPGM